MENSGEEKAGHYSRLSCWISVIQCEMVRVHLTEAVEVGRELWGLCRTDQQPGRGLPESITDLGCLSLSSRTVACSSMMRKAIVVTP